MDVQCEQLAALENGLRNEPEKAYEMYRGEIEEVLLMAQGIQQEIAEEPKVTFDEKFFRSLHNEWQKNASKWLHNDPDKAVFQHRFVVFHLYCVKGVSSVNQPELKRNATREEYAEFPTHLATEPWDSGLPWDSHRSCVDIVVRSEARAGRTVDLRKSLHGGRSLRMECASCGKVSLFLNRCARCRKVHYCDATCQKKHYTEGGHKKVCKKAG